MGGQVIHNYDVWLQVESEQHLLWMIAVLDSFGQHGTEPEVRSR